MRITYKMTEEELMAYNMFRAGHKNAGLIPMAIMISCGALAVMLIMGFMMKLSPWTYAVMFGLAALVFVVIVLFQRNRMKHSVKVMMFRQRKEDLMPQTTITLMADYFEVYKVDSESEIPYESLERLELTKQFIYLELDSNGEIGIPIRAFESIEQMHDFIVDFVNHTPNATHIGVKEIMANA